MSSYTLVDKGTGTERDTTTYTPLGGLTINELGLLLTVFDQANETRERAGQSARFFLFRGSIEDVKRDHVITPVNARWW